MGYSVFLGLLHILCRASESTTISMLVGLLTPTSGDATVFAKNIITDMDEIPKAFGVCPQNDILLQS
nr:abc transporter a family member 1 [Quercus suber]